MTAAPKPFAPDSLRATTPGSCVIPSAWQRPTARRPGGSPRRYRRSIGCSSAPGLPRVVALRGGRRDDAPHHPGGLPPGEGIYRLIFGGQASAPGRMLKASFTQTCLMRDQSLRHALRPPFGFLPLEGRARDVLRGPRSSSAAALPLPWRTNACAN